MALPVFLPIYFALTLHTEFTPQYLADKARYDEPETQSPYGRNPHGPDPHGADPHDENHDKNMPANNPGKYGADYPR